MSAATLRVLIVDDDHDTADTLAAVFEAWGYAPISAYSGQTALDLATQKKPHVVIFDLAMPQLDGYGFARHLRAIPSMENVLLICISGYPVDSQRAQEVGCTIHFLKPAPMDELARILAERATTVSD